jgi:hypothetical protein
MAVLSFCQAAKMRQIQLEENNGEQEFAEPVAPHCIHDKGYGEDPPIL